MLELIRQHTGSFFVKIILGMIILVFVFWGVGSMGNKNHYAAKVNDEKISLEEYQRTYYDYLKDLQDRFGNSFDEELLKSLNVEQQILNSMIIQVLLRQEAKKLGIEVSNEELKAYIHSIPAFKIDGLFSVQAYNKVLKYNRTTPVDFENEQRGKLLHQKMMLLIGDNAKISNEELREWYAWENIQYKVNYIKLACKNYDIELTKEDIEKYYKENSEAYKTEKQIKVQYVELAPKDYEAESKVTRKEVKQYYEANQHEFFLPSTIEASHIFLKVDRNKATKEEIQKIREKADKIYEMTKKERDFAKLAKKYSEDEATKNEGGYLGEFAKNAMDNEFAEVAFSLNVGEISKPVESQGGFHIIRVEKINKEKTLQLSEVFEDVQKKLEKEKMINKAFDEAARLADSVMEEDNLENIAKMRNLDLKKTKFFSMNNKDDKALSLPFKNFAFSLNDNEISEVQEINQKYYLIQLLDAKEPYIPKLSEIKDRVQKDLIEKKQEDVASKDAEKIINDAILKKSLKAAIDGKQITLKTSSYFKRDEKISNDIGPKISYAVIDLLSKDEKITKKPIQIKDAFYIFEYLNQKDIDFKDFDKEEIKETLIEKKRQLLFQFFINRLVQKSEIEINKAIFNQG